MGHIFRFFYIRLLIIDHNTQENSLRNFYLIQLAFNRLPITIPINLIFYHNSAPQLSLLQYTPGGYSNPDQTAFPLDLFTQLRQKLSQLKFELELFEVIQSGFLSPLVKFPSVIRSNYEKLRFSRKKQTFFRDKNTIFRKKYPSIYNRSANSVKVQYSFTSGNWSKQGIIISLLYPRLNPFPVCFYVTRTQFL